MNQRAYSLLEIAKLLGAELEGDPNCKISSTASLETANEGQICFLNNPRYRQYLGKTKASAVILTSEDAKNCLTNKIIMSNPHLGYAKVAKLFQYQPSVQKGIHPTAVIGENCSIDLTASIGAHCVIHDYAKIDKNTHIGAGCVVGEHAVIGESCKLYHNVVIEHHVSIGHHVTIQSGTIIGSEGFGNVKDDEGVWYSIPQLGTVKIGNYVEIGASTTIDRGSLKDTIIEDHVRLDNQIQIAHNVHIGRNTAIAGCAGIAGSAKIGANCMIGGGARIADNITICDDVILFGGAAVPQSISKRGAYASGLPLLNYKDAIKNALRYRELDQIARKINQLEKLCDEST